MDKSKSIDAFKDLPGIAAIVGGVWLTNIGYWGFNQYIIQKGLAAKSINEAQKGLIFAGFLKILIPFIVVIPGVTAFVMYNYPQDIPVFSRVISTCQAPSMYRMMHTLG